MKRRRRLLTNKWIPSRRGLLAVIATISTGLSIYLYTTFAGGGYTVASIAKSNVGLDCSSFPNACADGARGGWCADFVSWVFNKAYSPFYPYPNEPYAPNPFWEFHSVDAVRAYFQNAQIYRYNTADNRVSHPPAPGDVYIRTGSSHVGIIYAVHGSGNNISIDTVDGNWGGKVAYVTGRLLGGGTETGGIEGWGKMGAITIQQSDTRVSIYRVKVEAWWDIGSNHYYDWEDLPDGGATYNLDIDQRAGTDRGNGQYRGDMLRLTNRVSGTSFYLNIRKKTLTPLSHLRVGMTAFHNSRVYFDYEDLWSSSIHSWNGENPGGYGLKILQFGINDSNCTGSLVISCTGDFLRSR